jgi:hypothetical protein
MVNVVNMNDLLLLYMYVMHSCACGMVHTVVQSGSRKVAENPLSVADWLNLCIVAIVIQDLASLSVEDAETATTTFYPSLI